MLGFAALGRLALGQIRGEAAIAGVLSQTLADATVSAAGAVALKASASNTTGDATLSSAGAVAIVGSLAATLADASISATGALAVQGALSASLGDAAISAAGALRIQALLSATLEDAAVVAAGSGLQTITDSEVLQFPVDYFMEDLPQYRARGRTFEGSRGKAGEKPIATSSRRRRLSGAAPGFTTRTDKRGYD